jgi:hypothetical protein
MNPNRSFRDNVLRAVALIGLLLVLILGAWGIILLAFNLPTIAGNVGGSIIALFNPSATTSPAAVATSTTTVVTTTPPPSQTIINNPPPQQTYTPPPAQNTYVPAPKPVVQLWGNPDLSVRIISATPAYSNNYGGTTRMNVTFEITNIGTNVARAGWNFSATLPVGYTYTYNSPTQRALNPGDKIVYTLGFDHAYNPQYNNQYPYQQNQYQPYPTYTGNPNYYTSCYTYNGYQNVPAQCDNNGNVVNNTTYPYNTNQYPYGYSNSSDYVTITIDPWNRVYENNRANNTATIAIPN